MVKSKKSFWHNVQENKYFVLGAALLVIGLGLGGWYGYHWYTRKYRDAAAYQVLSRCIQELEHARQQGESSDWEPVLQACKAALDTRASRFAFLMESQALIGQGELEKAGGSLNEATVALRGSSIQFLAKTAYALLLLDVEKESEGITQLEELAQNADNPYFDYAAYYVGYYYWVKGNVDQARHAWEPLVAMVPEEITPADERSISPWALYAREKMAHLADIQPTKGS